MLATVAAAVTITWWGTGGCGGATMPIERAAEPTATNEPGPPTVAPENDAAPAPSTPAELRLVTYNVLATPAYAELRTRAVLRTLEDSKADIIALQEVAGWLLKPLLDEPWVRDGYRVTREGGQPIAPGGQLILSRFPIDDVQWGVLTGRQRRTVVAVRVRIRGRTLRVATTHMESFLEDGPVRAEQLTAIFRLLDGADDGVLLGDLNFGDGEQPETGRLDPRYRDLWTALKPGNPGYTWNMDENPLARYGAFKGEQNRRLDRILVRSAQWHAQSITIIGNLSAAQRPFTRAVRASIQMPDVDRGDDEPVIDVFPSDHYGLLGTLVWR